jgi:methionine-rich copper-binding protein CopC
LKIKTTGVTFAGALLATGLAPWTVSVPRAVAGDVDAMHLQLERSDPAKDATVTTSPDQISLWFNQSPQIRGTSVRVVPAGGDPLPTGEAKLAGDDGKLVVAPVTGSIPDGDYTVMWRAMASDGHVVRGEFGFKVAVAR